MAPDQPKQNPPGKLQGLITDARTGQAESPQSERGSYKPETPAMPVLPPLLDALGPSSWPESVEALRDMLGRMGYACRLIAGQREDWAQEDQTAHLYHFPAQGVTFLELVLVQDEANPDPAAAGPRTRAIAEAYATALAEAQARLGAPAFEGAFGDDGFPEDDDAVRLALWRQGQTRLSLQQKDDGPDFPMRLIGVIEPAGEA